MRRNSDDADQSEIETGRGDSVGDGTRQSRSSSVHADVAGLLEGITDAFFMLDRRWRFTYLNTQAERLLARSRAELMGADIRVEFPAAVGTASEVAYRRAMDAGVASSFEQFYPPLGRWFEARAFPTPEGVAVYFRDVSDARAAAEALRRSREDLRLAVNAAHLGTFYCEFPLDKIAWNETCKEHFFLSPEAEVDMSLFYSLLHPDDREPTRRAIERAQAERAEYNVEYRTLAPDGRTRWVNAVGRFHYHDDGTPARFDGVTLDISARKSAEEEVRRRTGQEALLNRIGLALRSSPGPEQVLETAVAELGRALGADRCYFVSYDQDADTATVGPDWHRDDLASLAGRYAMSPFAANRDPVYKAGRTQVVADTAGDAATQALGLRALVRVPLFSGTAMTALAVAMSGGPRGWTSDEVQLVEAVASLTRSAVEAARLLAERQDRLMREAFLGRVGAALRNTLDPGLIQERAAALLGGALGVDRCFYVAYDLVRDCAEVSEGWRREDLPPLAGVYTASAFRQLLAELFPAPRTAVADDVRVSFSPAVAAIFEASRHRAALVVPFFDEGALVAALYASQADAPRAWTPGEVSLAEQVATLTRAAVETARVQAREHAIAQQLQDALQPDVPRNIPGLSVGRLILPALDEAKVGGDFYDVFPLDEGLYALAIGDVSGKGLAAAQQLALVRNSLRTTLYLYQSAPEAAAAVNHIVTSHGLLVGFVTAWVGVYEAATGRITYCSCGHEPGLVRRAGGSVEALEATGPPLGVVENAEYDARSVALAEGDSLLLYTDGVSEAGPSRRELLGTDGLARLLTALPPARDPQAAAEALVGQVKTFAGGGFRDDVAVLLARRA